jgi:hypothetical protein
VDIAFTANNDEPVLESFYQWLAEDDDVARTADVTMRSTPGTGQMGAFDIVNVTLTHVAGFASLLMAYANWRRARAETAEVNVTVNGVSITVKDASPETVERILAFAESLTQQAHADD